MYITLQYGALGARLGEPIQLVQPIDCVNKRVALSKVIYTVSWFNISTAQNNNVVNISAIPDGYYNVALLQTAVQVIDPTFTLTINQATGKITLRCDNTITLGFASLLGFNQPGGTFNANTTYVSTNLPRLMNRVINITLDEINITENLANNTRSNILYSMVNRGSLYGDTIEYEVVKLQYKKLSDRYLNQLTVNMTDENGVAFNTNNILAIFVLKIDDG
jgi:hypothetical protein